MTKRLMHDHAELGDLLNQFIAALDANDVTRSHATLDLFWARLAMHIRAEHLHLFPAVSHAPEAERTIEQLREDHDFFMRELAQAIAVMRSLSANPAGHVVPPLEGVREKIALVKERLEKHNELEEKGIYLWTTNLSEADQSDLAARVHKELENMPARFRQTGQ